YVKDEEKNIPVIVPEEAEILRRIFDLYCTGEFGDQNLADFLNKAGFKTRRGRRWSKDTVRGVMRNEFYCGKVVHRDIVRPGIQEPIISEEQYHLAMKVRKEKVKNPRAYGYSEVAKRETDSVARNFSLQRIAYCDNCGLTLRVRPNGKHRYYADTARERGYTCTSKVKSIRIELAETLIIEILSKIKIPNDWQKLISDIAKQQDVILIQEKEKENLEKKIKRATELFLEGYITREEFDAQQAQYSQLLQNIQLPEEGYVCLSQLMVGCLGQYIDEANQAEISEICHFLFEKVVFNLNRQEIVALKVKPGYPFLLRQSLDSKEWKEEEEGYFVRIQESNS
ncbi:MAG: recombinase family protein, partial [Anaerolineaceae bacterium]|nr:recombinase family protein [Anaerolineaceae bacterium]